MSELIRRYNIITLLTTLVISLGSDYLSHGTHYQVYFLPISVAALTLPLGWTFAVGTGLSALSLLFTPYTNEYHGSYIVLLMIRLVFFNAFGLIISALLEKRTSHQDSIIRELSTHLDLNKTLHKLLINDSKTAIEVVNKECKIVSWNELAADLTGISDAIGKLHTEVFAQSLQNSQSKLVETVTTGKEYLDHELILYFPERTPITALVTIYALRNEQQEIVGALAIYRDITQKKLLEQQLRRDEKFSALGQMAAGLAHEIRNPLTTVKGFLQLLSPEQLSPKYSEYRDLMLTEVNRTNELISDFVLLSNPSAPVFQQVDLAELVGLVFELFHGRAVVNGITLLNQVPNLQELYLDCEQFKHLLLSLYDNSIEAMPDGGIFGVHATVLEDKVQIQIWDTGRGIPQEIMDKVFDPFFSTKEEGSGLGLSICYQIVLNHGGNMYVNSRSGSGTTFTITLPLAHPVLCEEQEAPANFCQNNITLCN